MKKPDAKTSALWAGVGEEDFLKDNQIEDVDIATYNKENMIYFSANTNYFRQVIRLSDSLKPVWRRILLSLYRTKTYGGKKAKSSTIVGETIKIHPHSDDAIYEALVLLAQPWKTAVPLINGYGNFGNAKDDPYAASRYTEATMSKYAYECFFSDYDPECVENIPNMAYDEETEEPLALPSKFPNILVNGGVGMAPGNAFRIPPFNIDDIIKNTKKVLNNPNCGPIYMLPDLPTGCPIVDSGNSLKELCEAGTTTLRMRATIDIEKELVTCNRKKCWVLRIRNVPWMVSLRSVRKRLLELKKSGQLNFEEIQDHSWQQRNKDGSYSMIIDVWILIDQSYDPYQFRSKIWKATDLDKGVSADLKSVTDQLKVERFSVKDLIQTWIDERRSYLRRLYNKRLVRLNERIELLEILIRILDKKNIQKTIEIVRTSKDDELIQRLAKHGNMTHYQAARLAESSLKQLTAEARERYKKELPEKKAEREEVLEIMRSEKKIDAIIASQLDDLKKYASPRRSPIVTEDESSVIIPDTTHILMISNQGYVKKLPFDSNNPAKNHSFGAFAAGDYPSITLLAKNLDSVIFFDSMGKCSIIPVCQIDSVDPSLLGIRAYDLTKLDGKIVQVVPQMKSEFRKKSDTNSGESYVVTLTKNAYLKKTKFSEYLKIKSSKNIRAAKIRPDDGLIYAGIVNGNPNILVYTRQGKYIYCSLTAFEETMKDTSGLQAIRLEDGDECAGVSIIDDKEEYIGLVTERGFVKRCEAEYLGSVNKRRSASASLINLEANDALFFVGGMIPSDYLTVITSSGVTELTSDQIPILTRKARGVKRVPVPAGAKILRCAISREVRKM